MVPLPFPKLRAPRLGPVPALSYSPNTASGANLTTGALVLPILTAASNQHGANTAPSPQPHHAPLSWVLPVDLWALPLDTYPCIFKGTDQILTSYSL